MRIDRFRVTRWGRSITCGAAVVAIGLGLGGSLLPARPANALNDAVQMFTGGNSLPGPSIRFTAPGLATHYGINFPAAGLGERAAEMRMPAGVANNLRVRVTTATAPTSGSFSMLVRRNRADTQLLCVVPATSLASRTGNCTASLDTPATFAGNDRLAIVIMNDLADAGALAYTYTFEFN